MIKRLFKKIKRSIQYAIFGWNNEDWDHGYLYDLLIFKLKRIETMMKTSECVSFEKKDIQSIRLCLKLLEKLKNENYTINYDALDNKYGKLVMDVDKDGYCQFLRNGIRTKDMPDYLLDSKLAITRDEKQHERDIKLLFDIMAKYHRRWWE